MGKFIYLLVERCAWGLGSGVDIVSAHETEEEAQIEKTRLSAATGDMSSQYARYRLDRCNRSSAQRRALLLHYFCATYPLEAYDVTTRIDK